MRSWKLFKKGLCRKVLFSLLKLLGHFLDIVRGQDSGLNNINEKNQLFVLKLNFVPRKINENLIGFPSIYPVTYRYLSIDLHLLLYF